MNWWTQLRKRTTRKQRAFRLLAQAYGICAVVRNHGAKVPAALEVEDFDRAEFLIAEQKRLLRRIDRIHRAVARVA